jgi:hypothetical protein
MKVINRPRWTRTKFVAAGLTTLFGIAQIGGLEGTDPLPHTWPLGLLSFAVATSILWTCRSEDF